MAVTDQQKLDFLLKKIGYTKTKTGSVVGTGAISGTPKQPFAEAIPSPLIIANGALWNESGSIPATPPGSDTAQVKVYLAATSGLRMTADSTSSGQRAFIAYSTYGNSSSTRLTNWIDTQFGSAYLIKVYKGDPNSGGVALSAAGSGANDGWFFDYSAGVLNFNDTSVPSGVTDTNIYIVGYRYIGLTGAPTPTGGGNFTFNDLVVSRNFQVAGLSTFNGLVDINAGGQANTFKVEDLTDNRIVIAGTGGELEDSANLTFDGSTLGVTGDATFSGNVSIGGTLTYEDVKNVDAVGLITARSGIRVTGGVIEAQAGENKIPSLYAAMGNLPSAGSYHGMFAHVHATGRGYFAHAGNWLELVNKEVNGVVGTGTETYNIGNLVSVSSTATSFNVTGVTTVVTLDVNGDIDVDGHTNLDNVSIAGVTTFASALFAEGNSIEIKGTNPYLALTDTDSNPDYSLFNSNGVFSIYDGTNSANRLTISSSGNVGILQDLDVDGHTNLDNVSIAGVTTTSGLLDINAGGQANTFKVEDLTSGRVVLAGAGGELEDNANLTFDGSNLFVSGINVTSAGTTSTFGADIVTRNLKSTGIITAVTVDINGDLDVDGHTNLDNVSVAGVTTFAGNARFNSTITAGGSIGSNGQYLKSTGSGVAWDSFPSLRTRQTFTASAGQTTFSFAYTIGFLDVYVNGIKLTDAEFTATNGSTTVLAVGCFVGDIVELVAYNTVSAGGGAFGIGNLVEDLSPQLGGNLDLFNKSITGTGNVNITGIVTATKFVGDGSSLSGIVASGSGVVIKDSGSLVGTAGTINFGNNLSVSAISGGSVTVTAAAGGGSTAEVRANTLNVIGVSTFAGITTFTESTHFGGISKTYTFYAHPNTPQYYMQWNTSGSGYLKFADGVHSYYGTNNRTQFDPHGSGSSGHFRIEQYMDDGNNPFQIHSDFTNIVGSPTAGHESRKIADFEYQDGCQLYYLGNKKLQTSGVGVTVTGSIDVSDIRSDALTLKNAAGGATYATFSNGGSATLNWNNTPRLQTTNAGITVTGTVAATSYTGDGSQLTGITAGISTISGVVNIVNDLDVDGHTNLDNVSIAGVTTFAGAIDLNADLDVDGHTNLDNVTIVGVCTATNFVGDGSGLTNVIGSGSGIVVEDSGSTVGTAGTINFANGLDVTDISAGIVTVSTATTSIISGDSKVFVNDESTTTNNGSFEVLLSDTTSSGAAHTAFRIYSPAANSNSAEFFHNNTQIFSNIALKANYGGNTNQSIQFRTNNSNFEGQIVHNTAGGTFNFYNTYNGTQYNPLMLGTTQIYTKANFSPLDNNTYDLGYSVGGTNLKWRQLHVTNVNAGVVTATTFHGDGSNLTGISGGGGTNVGITTNLSGSFTASAGSASTINTLTGYSANDLVVEYTIYIKNGSDFQTQKLLAMRDGTTIHSTQFAVMFSSSLLVQCDATISSGNILLRATPETGVSGSTTYKIKREVM